MPSGRPKRKPRKPLPTGHDAEWRECECGKRFLHHFFHKCDECRGRNAGVTYMPTPEEIADAAEKEREGWTEAVEQRRRVGNGHADIRVFRYVRQSRAIRRLEPMEG